MFDGNVAKKRLKLLESINLISWVITSLLFLVPFYQLLTMGSVPINMLFIGTTIANIIFISLSFYMGSKIKFVKYQINYFSKTEGT